MARAANRPRQLSRSRKEKRPQFCLPNLLIEAWQYAEVLGSDPWEFAVELPALLSAGATINQLRAIACGGLVNYRREVTQNSAESRQFEALNNLAFPPGTCFVLRVPPSESLAGSPRAMPRFGWAEMARSNAQPALKVAQRPRWDPASRTLYVGARIVKRYRVPAVLQERILNAFQEEGWPTHVYDPLSPNGDKSTKRRLHDTIKALNRHHRCRLIRFIGNGNGEAVGWAFVGK